MKAHVWPLLNWPAWAQRATVLYGRTGEGAALALVRLSACPCQPLWWRARQVSSLLWPLLARSASAQTAIVLAETTSEGAALASARLVGVGSANYCGGGHKS
jgi:hypothetical protein